MDFDLHALIELNKEPMFLIKNNRISDMNTGAQKLLGGNYVGKSAVDILPEHILASSAEKFVSSAVVNGKNCTASASRMGGMLVISLSVLEPKPASPGILSDTIMNSMLSTLFNIGIAVNRLDGMLDKNASPKADDYISIANHSYYTLLRLISNLNTAKALRQGSMDFFPRSVNLAKLCSDIVSTLAVLVREKNLDLEFSTTHGELCAYVDSEKVERVLLNLLANSISHTAPGGKIKLGLSQCGDNAIISVDDNGSGISAEILQNIFSRYDERIRAISGGDAPSGGLGLDISRGIAEKHGGALIIESRENVGTSVRVLLPLGDADRGSLESPDFSWPTPNMHLVLTELSGILSRKFYSKKYLD